MNTLSILAGRRSLSPRVLTRGRADDRDGAAAHGYGSIRRRARKGRRAGGEARRCVQRDPPHDHQRRLSEVVPGPACRGGGGAEQEQKGSWGHIVRGRACTSGRWWVPHARPARTRMGLANSPPPPPPTHTPPTTTADAAVANDHDNGRLPRSSSPWKGVRWGRRTARSPRYAPFSERARRPSCGTGEGHGPREYRLPPVAVGHRGRHRSAPNPGGAMSPALRPNRRPMADRCQCACAARATGARPPALLLYTSSHVPTSCARLL